LDFAEGTPLDILALHAALRTYQEGADEINVSESGTAMRFICAYLTVTTQRPVRLSGTGRQHERPIAPLVEALRSQGAKITYLNHEGYPPLLIEPSTFAWQGCELDASSSSQYLSALLLLAPALPVGFQVDTRRNGLASRPYALMTIAQLREQGFIWEEASSGLFCYRGKKEGDSRGVSPHTRGYEADWSAASYAYALLSLLPIGSTIELSELALPSLQGDAAYLAQLSAVLPNLFQQHQPDFVFYQSGVDVLESDKLGKLNLSIEGCAERDKLVFEQCKKRQIPIQCSTGGGYSPRLSIILTAHTNTFKVAKRVFDI